MTRSTAVRTPRVCAEGCSALQSAAASECAGCCGWANSTLASSKSSAKTASSLCERMHNLMTYASSSPLLTASTDAFGSLAGYVWCEATVEAHLQAGDLLHHGNMNLLEALKLRH